MPLVCNLFSVMLSSMWENTAPMSQTKTPSAIKTPPAILNTRSHAIPKFPIFSTWQKSTIAATVTAAIP